MDPLGGIQTGYRPKRIAKNATKTPLYNTWPYNMSKRDVTVIARLWNKNNTLQWIKRRQISTEEWLVGWNSFLMKILEGWPDHHSMWEEGSCLVEIVFGVKAFSVSVPVFFSFTYSKRRLDMTEIL